MRVRPLVGVLLGPASFVAMIAGYTILVDGNEGHYADAGSHNMWLVIAAPVGAVLGLGASFARSSSWWRLAIAYAPAASVTFGDGILTGGSVAALFIYLAIATGLCLIAWIRGGIRAGAATVTLALAGALWYVLTMQTFGLVP